MGETAIVTGAAVRVGRAIALQLSSQGYELVIQYRNSEKAALDLVNQIHHAGGLATASVLDLSDIEAIPRWVDQLRGICANPITGIVNCAALFEKGEDIEKHLTVNTIAAYRLILEVHRGLEAGMQGCAVNITDAHVQQPAAGYAAYYASKGALESLTFALARDLGPNFRVNAVAPGLVLAREGKDGKFFERRAQALPLGRTGSPEDIAAAVSYLMRSDFVTGEIIRVDGGDHLL
jgi:NAD(P)-dependent dehydrogenase (short-subunit alcohol dehydrogenase family)